MKRFLTAMLVILLLGANAALAEIPAELLPYEKGSVWALDILPNGNFLHYGDYEISGRDRTEIDDTVACITPDGKTAWEHTFDYQAESGGHKTIPLANGTYVCADYAGSEINQLYFFDGEKGLIDSSAPIQAQLFIPTKDGILGTDHLTLPYLTLRLLDFSGVQTGAIKIPFNDTVYPQAVIESGDGFILHIAAGWPDEYASILKVDREGNVLWQEMYFAPKNRVYGLYPDGADGAYVLYAANDAYMETVAQRYSADGALMWEILLSHPGATIHVSNVAGENLEMLWDAGEKIQLRTLTPDMELTGDTIRRKPDAGAGLQYEIIGFTSNAEGDIFLYGRVVTDMGLVRTPFILPLEAFPL